MTYERFLRVGCAGLPPRMARTAYFGKLHFLEDDTTFNAGSISGRRATKSVNVHARAATKLGVASLRDATADDAERMAAYFHRPDAHLDTLIDRFARFNRCTHDACMSDHITVCKIETHKVNFAFFEFRYQSIGEFEGTHFWLQIVSCYFRRVF